MEFLSRLIHAIEPILPGIVLGALFVVLVVALRVAMRHAGLAEKLRLPSTFLTTYFVTVGLLVASKLYWPRVAGMLFVVSLIVLTSAAVLSVSFGVFDLFLGRYRQISVPAIIRDLVVLVVYVVAIVVVLGQQGFDLTGVITTSAVLTAIIGFALQDLLSNVVSGLALEIERPFKVGDWVKFGDQEGEILEVNWRSTKIKTLHYDIVIVPNNVITKSSLINMSVPTPIHRRKLAIGLRYEAPPNKAKESILKAVRGVEGVLEEPPPFVLLKSYDDFSIAYRVHFFIDRLHAKERIEDRVFTRLWYQLKRDGLSIPFPIRDINVRQLDAGANERGRQQALAETIATLSRVPFLVPLNSEELALLADGTRSEFFAAGEKIIRQGELGDSFYLIASGEVDVCVGADEQRVASLSAGDYFGEMSLMTGEARSATVAAMADTRCYVIGKQTFSGVLQRNEALVEQIAAKLEARRQGLLSHRKSAGANAPERPGSDDQEGNIVGRIRRFFGL